MSRLESFIRRMSAQRDILDMVCRDMQLGDGPVIELGLGNGRTYDHLRERLPGRRIIAFASSVVSSPLSRRGCAIARQCWQARSQAWVVSQMAMNGAESKSRFRRDGALCG